MLTRRTDGMPDGAGDGTGKRTCRPLSADSRPFWPQNIFCFYGKLKKAGYFAKEQGKARQKTQEYRIYSEYF